MGVVKTLPQKFAQRRLCDQIVDVPFFQVVMMSRILGADCREEPSTEACGELHGTGTNCGIFFFSQILWDIAEVVKAFYLHRNAVGAVGQRVNVSVLQILEEIV